MEDRSRDLLISSSFCSRINFSSASRARVRRSSSDSWTREWLERWYQVCTWKCWMSRQTTHSFNFGSLSLEPGLFDCSLSLNLGSFSVRLCLSLGLTGRLHSSAAARINNECRQEERAVAVRRQLSHLLAWSSRSSLRDFSASASSVIFCLSRAPLAFCSKRSASWLDEGKINV